MSYENDGYMGYVLTTTYEDTVMAPGGTVLGDREQAQAQAACLEAKARGRGERTRYGVAGLVPIPDVPISTGYSGPFHGLDDDCDAP